MNMDHVPRMDWSVPNVAETFKLFKQRIELYFKAKRIEIADQVVHILLQVGDEGLRRYNSWTVSEEDKTDPKKIFAAFEEQLEPPENYRISRLKLTQYRQTHEESLDDFTNRCKLQALKCDFVDDELNDRLMRSRHFLCTRWRHYATQIFHADFIVYASVVTCHFINRSTRLKDNLFLTCLGSMNIIL